MFRSMILGDSPPIQLLRLDIMRVASSDGPVVIQGETGVGKELVAHDVHSRSERRQGPFIAVDCASIVESLFETELFGIEDGAATGVRARTGKVAKAHSGTLFLDEVAELSAAGQAKLLRVLQEFAVVRVGSVHAQHVDVRIIAATNRSLRSLVEKGAFREDLFYRLNGLEINVPPLRARRQDIVPLTAHFATQIRKSPISVCREAGVALERYRWPGNVRELRRAVECALTFRPDEQIKLPHLPSYVRGPFEEVLAPALGRGDTLRDWSASYVALTLNKCGGNKRRACQVLGISYHTLRAHLERSNLKQLPTCDSCLIEPA